MTHPDTQLRITLLLEKPYHWVFVPERKGGFSARILEFPGCFAEGDSLVATYGNLRQAAYSWLLGVLSSDMAVPEPLP